MVADADTEEVLGVSMVGHTAGEVIHEVAMAMRFHGKINGFIELLHGYPTMAEALKIIDISRREDPAKPLPLRRVIPKSPLNIHHPSVWL
jgi:mercuric reductase